jgi:flagellar hook assembly protein FlgD
MPCALLAFLVLLFPVILFAQDEPILEEVILEYDLPDPDILPRLDDVVIEYDVVPDPDILPRLKGLSIEYDLPDPAAPIADAGPDQVVENVAPEGTSVRLDGSGSWDPDDDIVSYEWFKEETLIATGVLADVILPVGVYTITLKVTDATGLSSTDTVVIEVKLAGVKFSLDIYSLTIFRAYNQKRTLYLYNPDPVVHTAYCKLIDPPEDILGSGFVGEGAEDLPATLAPGEQIAVTLVFHVPDADELRYSLTAKVTTSPEGLVHTTSISLHIRQPAPYLSIELVEEHPGTLVRKYRVTNTGDPIYNLKIMLEGELAEHGIVYPSITHAFMPRGGAMEFYVIPVYWKHFRYLRGNIMVGGSQTVMLPQSWRRPDGKIAWEVTLDHPKIVFDLWNYYCTNKPSFRQPFWLSWLTLDQATQENWVYGLLTTRFKQAFLYETPPHDVRILMNQTKLEFRGDGQLENTVPDGYYTFEVPREALLYPDAFSESTENTIVLESTNPPGHYSIAADMRVAVAVKKLTLYMIGEDPEDAERNAWELPNVWPNAPGLSVEILSPQQDQKVRKLSRIELKVKVTDTEGNPQEVLEYVSATFSNQDPPEPLYLYNGTEGVFTAFWKPTKTGKVTIIVEAKNSRTKAQAKVTVYVDDNEPPVVTILAPKEGDVLSGTTKIRWDIQDPNNDPVKANLYWSGSKEGPWEPIAEGLSTSWEYKWNTTALFNGYYYIRVYAWEDLKGVTGAVADAVSGRFEIKNRMQVAQIMYPYEGAYVKGLVDIGGTAYSTQPDQTYSLWYGEGSAPVSWVRIPSVFPTASVKDGVLGWWDTAGLDGVYSLKVVLDDTGVEASVTLTVDNVPPVVEITDPAEGEVIAPRNNMLKVRGTAYDANFREYFITAVHASQVYAITLMAIDFPVVDGVLAQRDITDFESGMYTLRLIARDLADNYARVEVNFELVKDTESPVVSDVVVTPRYTNANPKLTATATDTQSDIMEAEFYIDDDPGEGKGEPMDPYDGKFDEPQEKLIAQIDISGLADGVHTAYVRTRDVANEKWSDSVGAEFVVDTVPPHVTDITVEPDPVTKDYVRISATATDALTNITRAEFFIDHDPGIGKGVPMDPQDDSFDSPSEGLVKENWYVCDLPEGEHTVYVRACDQAGNWTDPAPAKSFIVNKEPLKVTPLGFKPSYVNTTYGSGVDDAYLYYELTEQAIITVKIYEYVNEVFIKTIVSEAVQGAGVQVLTWDGTDEAGKRLPGGEYYFEITGTDAFTNPFDPKRSIDYPAAPEHSQIVKIVNQKPAIGWLSVEPATFNPALESLTIAYYLYAQVGPPGDTRDLDVTVQIMDEAENLVRVLEEVQPASPEGIRNSVVWDGRDSKGNLVEAGIYTLTVSARDPRDGPDRLRLANPKSASVVVIYSTTYLESKDGVLGIYFTPDWAKVQINQRPFIPVSVLYTLYGLHHYGSYLVSSIYELKLEFPISPPAFLVFRLPEGISARTAKILVYSQQSRRWEAILPFVSDPGTRRVIARVQALSLVALISNRDVYNPRTEALTISPARISFVLKDDISGVDIDLTRIFLDGKDVTGLAFFDGKNGDPKVAVQFVPTFLDPEVEHTLKIIARDMAGNRTIKEERFKVGLIEAVLYLAPDVLKVNPGVLTAYVQFPHPYDVSRITEAYLDGAPAKSFTYSQEGEPEEGIEGPTMIIKFMRKDVEEALAKIGQEIDTTFVITGSFWDPASGYQLSYHGSATIKAVIK